MAPPIMNSSSLWASSRVQLEGLYLSDWTGGVTTRTATTLGFAEDANVHKVLTVILLSPLSSSPKPLLAAFSARPRAQRYFDQ